jgi:hypothetical protein
MAPIYQTRDVHQNKTVLVAITNGEVTRETGRCPTGAITQEFVALSAQKISLDAQSIETIQIQHPEGYEVRYNLIRVTGPFQVEK